MNPIIAYITEFMDFAVEQLEYSVNQAKIRGQTILPIMINSSGGSVFRLFEMLDIIDNSGLKIITIVNGIAFSAGAVLFAAGQERHLSKRSSLMIHDLSTLALGKNSDIQSSAKFSAEKNQMLYDVLDKASGKASGYWQEKVKANAGADLFLNAEEGLKEGLVTSIGIPDIQSLFKDLSSSFSLSEAVKAKVSNDYERYELYAQFVPSLQANKPEHGSAKNKRAKPSIINNNFTGGKKMDLEQILAALQNISAELTGDKAGLLIEAGGQLKALSKEINDLKANSAAELAAKVSNYESQIKALEVKNDNFIISSLVAENKLTKVEADRKMSIMAKLSGETKEEYIKDLIETSASRQVIPSEIDDKGDNEQDMSGAADKPEILKSLKAIADIEKLNLSNPKDLIKAQFILNSEAGKASVNK